MKNLIDIFKSHNQKIVCKWNHYLEHYERHFHKYVNKEISILEIGVENGGSLQLWKKYFGNKCSIVGIDIDEKCKYEEEQIKVEIGDQSDLNFLNFIVNTYGPFDIIIDDGSHMQKHIQKTFNYLYDYLKEDGVYVIEDVHCSYFSSFQGGVKTPTNFVNYLLTFIHDINFRYIKEFFYTKKLNNLKSICFYDSLIFIEKEKEIDRYVEVIGKDTYKKLTPEDIF
jgi:SAM-dependent methyltransferase